MKKEDESGFVRRLVDENSSIAVGLFSISVLLMNRLFTGDLSNAQSRVDLLGIAVASALLVSALSTIDLEVREKETVKLAGVRFEEIPKELGKEREALLLWSLQAVLKVCSNAQSVIIAKGGATLVRYGTMGRNQQLKEGAIVKSAMVQGKQQYLADLQILPGRFEFDYLPVNTQALLIQPVGDVVMIVGANKVRPLTARDLVMLDLLAPIIGFALEA